MSKRRVRLPRNAALATLLLGLAYAALFMVPNTKIWLGERFLGWDVINYGWPNLEFLYQSLISGNFPLWNPFEKAGHSFIGDPQAALLYPVQWLFCLVRGVGGEGPWIALVQSLVHIAIVGVGTHRYLKRQGFSPAVCWFGAGAFILSSRFARSKDQVVLGAVAWLPWMLIALDDLLERPSWRTALRLGGVVGLDFVAGYPPDFFRNIVALVIVSCAKLGRRLFAPTTAQPSMIRISGAIALSVTVFVGLALPGLVGLSEDWMASERSHMSAHELYRAHYVAPPIFLLTTFVPSLDIRGFTLSYAGMLPAVLAVFAMLRPSRTRWLYAGVATFFFLLSTGDRSVFLPAVIKVLPVFGYWRYPDHYLFVALFFLCVLACFGLQDFLREGALSRRRDKVGLAIILAGVLVIVGKALDRCYNEVPRYPEIPRGAWFSLGLVVLCSALLIALWRAPITRRAKLVWLCTPLVLLDVAFVMRPVWNVLQPHRTFRRDAVLPKLSGVMTREYRIDDDRYFGDRVGMRHGIHEVFGRAAALTSRRFVEYRSMAHRHVRMLPAANVRYYAGNKAGYYERSGKPHTRRIHAQLVEFTNPAPRAYWTPTANVFPTAKEGLTAVSASVDPLIATVVARDVSTADEARLKVASTIAPLPLTVNDRNVNELSLTVDAPATGLVVINDAYAAGWRAFVDGKATKILPVNTLFRGVVVDAGRHEVVMTYGSNSLRAALVVYALTLAALVLAVLWDLRDALSRRHSGA